MVRSPQAGSVRVVTELARGGDGSAAASAKLWNVCWLTAFQGEARAGKQSAKRRKPRLDHERTLLLLETLCSCYRGVKVKIVVSFLPPAAFSFLLPWMV